MAIKRILINATYHNAIRIAYTQGIQLSSFEVEHAGEENSLGNIYKGKITSVNNSLECAFVDIGLERQGMLPFKRLVNDTNSNESSDSVDYERVSKQLRVGPAYSRPGRQRSQSSERRGINRSNLSSGTHDRPYARETHPFRISRSE